MYDVMQNFNKCQICSVSLLSFIALSAAQSSAQPHIHSAVLVIDTSNNASYNQVHWFGQDAIFVDKS